MENISKIDWELISSRVANAVTQQNFDTNSKGFLSLVLEQMFPGITPNIHEVITDGADDRGVDAIHIIEGEENAEIYVFQAKYREKYEGQNKTINENEVLKVSNFIYELFEKSESLSSCGNLRLKESVQRIWDIHSEGKICKYQIVFCTNGKGFSESANKVMNSVCSTNRAIDFELYNAHSFLKSLSSEGKANADGKLQVISKEIYERADGDVRGAIASIDAKSFIELITEDDDSTIVSNLFDDNLRVFLGLKGGYNASIIETATSDDSYLFWYLNNVITITCKNFTYNKGHSNPTLNFKDFQIVNGAQTSHSLVEAFRRNPDRFDDVVLMVRVYATDRQDIAEKVAVATNSQARIQSRDLRANHPILKTLEIAFRERGYFFERKRNMHSTKPESVRIDALKLGQIILSFHLREPDKAKTDSDSIFSTRFTQIFHNRWDIDELINVFSIYQKIENLRNEYLYEFGSSPESGQNNQYLVYGHWFILFACSLHHIKSEEKKLPTGKKADALVEQAIQTVANACTQSKAVAHYQMFRSAKTRERILGEIGAQQIDFFDLLNP